ncbi:hypothetical protein E4Z66_03905 [Aliishimia ponticola]|uniref:Uncharacterized protein n=1 Tax=Aliishimia ponticola TaxID=2499833 RepID=A0A4S4NKB7_9RHOB|nr:hypothetical protein [Aliishimia ponticola]THH38721.1 hypothetical protein E4Z66_03905 [Aliishimia ponticola]
MDKAIIQSQWSGLTAALQKDFPHAQIPDIFPHGALWDSLIDRLARTHDLTPDEALETLEDRCLGLLLQDADEKAA